MVSTSRVAAANLGDELILDTCTDIVRHIVPRAEITTVFRQASWASVAESVTSSDLVVIACLAIRKRMLRRAYPYLRELVASGRPIAVVAAGISLNAFSARRPVTALLSKEEVEVLRSLADKALFFSTRGCFTQSLMAQLGIKTTFAGDVAFYQPEFAERRFQPPSSISRIAISDPHYTDEYQASFKYLVQSIRNLFPAAKIDLLIHGRNPAVIPLAAAASVPAIVMSEQRGLAHYDDYDLHVGYRIQGHVSALARRIPSYLVEQDDRGTDYGATFSRRMSVASHRDIRGLDWGASARWSIFGRALGFKQQVLCAPIDTLAAIIRQDIADGFARFLGLETELEACADRNYAGVEAAVASLMERHVVPDPASVRE
jgi:hypothetical protein